MNGRIQPEYDPGIDRYFKNQLEIQNVRVPYGEYTTFLIRGFDSSSKQVVDQDNLVWHKDRDLERDPDEAVQVFFQVNTGIDAKWFSFPEFDLIIIRDLADLECFKEAVQ